MLTRTNAGIPGEYEVPEAIKEVMGEANDSDVFGEVFPDASAIKRFRDSVIDWFENEGRDYPWRNTTDPYAILVSELMLQQTRIATVLDRDYFGRWLRLFPDVHALAEAKEEEILKAWEGLGYYNRARNLQKAARKVVEDGGGDFPTSLEEMEGLPGVGRYTAGAVFSFAYDRRAPIVDGNVIRVLSRLFGYEKPVDTPGAVKQMWQWADLLTPKTEVRAYNSGIMELGQRICTRGVPNCSACPVQSFCRANSLGNAEKLPRKKGKPEITQKEEIVGLFIKSGEILLEVESGTRRKGLWKLPEISKEEAGDWEELFRLRYSITRYRVEMSVFLATPNHWERSGYTEWYPLQAGEGLPALGSPYRKAILKYLDIRDDLTMNW